MERLRYRGHEVLLHVAQQEEGHDMECHVPGREGSVPSYDEGAR